MEDRVGEVLARRAALESGAAAGVALSVFLHVAAAAIVIYAAMHHPPAQSVDVITINLAPMTAPKAGTRGYAPGLASRKKSFRALSDRPRTSADSLRNLRKTAACPPARQ